MKSSSELELTEPNINGTAAPHGFKYDISSGRFDSRHTAESEVESSREFDSKDLTDTRQLYGSHKSRSTPIESIQIRHDNLLNVAPEYAMTGHLLVKSDGVVSLGLLSGRKPVDMSQPSGQENLVTWARPILRDKDRLEELADLQEGR